MCPSMLILRKRLVELVLVAVVEPDLLNWLGVVVRHKLRFAFVLLRLLIGVVVRLLRAVFAVHHA